APTPGAQPTTPQAIRSSPRNCRRPTPARPRRREPKRRDRRCPSHQGTTRMLKKYAYAWITLAFFTVSITLHWIFGWFAFVDEQSAHGQAAELSPYLLEMGRDTFENWQSEFLQLLWQVVGLAYFLYV